MSAEKNNLSPFISIIMAVYNNEKYFPNAVESILGQTFDDWELVIVDDGSTDNTPDIADRFAAKDTRIKVIHQQNQWIYKSFNNGIAAATGDYVLVVNSDDTINTEALQKIHDIALIDDADIVMFNLCPRKYSENGITADLIRNKNSNLLENDFSYSEKSEIHKNWINFLKKKLINHQCVYKSTIAKKIPYRTDTYAGDFFYNIDIANNINKAAGTSYIVYNFLFYSKENMNASSGKYYEYEHKMNNDMYLSHRKLLEGWKQWNDECDNYLSKVRLTYVTCEAKGYSAPNCRLSINDKLKKIFDCSSDELIYSCAQRTGRLEELESRILSGCKELLIKEIPEETDEYYFVYQMLNALLCYEKTQDDMDMLIKCIYHKNNPKHIGEHFYNKLKK